jgi:internalin A
MTRFVLILNLVFVFACAPRSPTGLSREADGSDSSEEGIAERFAALCMNNELSIETKNTVKFILEEMETSDCLEAGESLVEESALDLSERNVQDVSPILVFTGLEKLSLAETGVKIEEVKKLSRLGTLTHLSLRENNLRSLQGLPETVEHLDIGLNPVERDLKNLTYLKSLNLKTLHITERTIIKALQKALPKTTLVLNKPLELFPSDDE